MNDWLGDAVVCENPHEEVAESVHLLTAGHRFPVSFVFSTGNSALFPGLRGERSPVLLNRRAYSRLNVFQDDRHFRVLNACRSSPRRSAPRAFRALSWILCRL